MRTSLSLILLGPALALAAAPSGGAYGWPVKPFDRAHAIRASFGDPRFHAGESSAISAFHFGVDVVARDGSAVYAVEPGWVIRRHPTSLTIGRASGRRFGYWHVRPVVRSGTYVHLHQLVGHVIAGWGHVHLAESVLGHYRDPLRKGALTPFFDHTVPTVDGIAVIDPEGAAVNPAAARGLISVVAEAYDTPPILPPAPWDVARLAPATVAWKLVDATGAALAGGISISFGGGLPDSSLYGWFYAAGTYQNKPHRPGSYRYWIFHDLDTLAYPNGLYRLEVDATDTRGNRGSASLDLTIANG
jgi:hypothetical protein